MKVVIRILGRFENQLARRIGWSSLQNKAELNSEQMKRYVEYLSKKGYVKVTDLGHRHKVVEITQEGLDFLKYLREHL